MIKLNHVSRLYPARAETNGGVIRALDDDFSRSCTGRMDCRHGPVRLRQIHAGQSHRLPRSSQSGEIWLDGEDVAGISTQDLNRVRAEKIGFIFQQFHLIPYLTARRKRHAGAILSQHDR